MRLLLFRSNLINKLEVRFAVDVGDLVDGDDLVGSITILIKGMVASDTIVVGLHHRVDDGLAESLGTSGIVGVLWCLGPAINGALNGIEQHLHAVIATRAIGTVLVRAIGFVIVVDKALGGGKHGLVNLRDGAIGCAALGADGLREGGGYDTITTSKGQVR